MVHLDTEGNLQLFTTIFTFLYIVCRWKTTCKPVSLWHCVRGSTNLHSSFFYASSPQSTPSVFTLFSAFLMCILHLIAAPDGFSKSKEKSNRTRRHHLFRRIITCHCAKTKRFYFVQQKWVSQFVTALFYFVAAIRLFNGGHKHLFSCGWRAEPLLRITATDELLVIHGMKLSSETK